MRSKLTNANKCCRICRKESFDIMRVAICAGMADLLVAGMLRPVYLDASRSCLTSSRKSKFEGCLRGSTFSLPRRLTLHELDLRRIDGNLPQHKLGHSDEQMDPSLEIVGCGISCIKPGDALCSLEHADHRFARGIVPCELSKP